MTIPQHTVIQYVRNKKGIPYGVLVGVKREGGGFNLGYSLCKKGDKFSKEMALKIAIGRAVEDSWPAPHLVPRDVRKMVGDFLKRCNKYYK